MSNNGQQASASSFSEMKRGFLVFIGVLASVGSLSGIASVLLWGLSDARAQARSEVTPIKAEVTLYRDEVSALRSEVHEIRKEQRSFYDFVKTGRLQPLLERPLPPNPPPLSQDGGL